MTVYSRLKYTCYSQRATTVNGVRMNNAPDFSAVSRAIIMIKYRSLAGVPGGRKDITKRKRTLVVIEAIGGKRS